MSSTQKIRELLIGTNMERGEIAKHLGIVYQAVYRIEKSLPKLRSQMQAEFQATGGVVDITSLVATVRQDGMPKEPLEYREFRWKLYDIIAKTMAPFGVAMQGVLRGASMKWVMEKLDAGVEQVSMLESTTMIEGWALRLNLETEFKRESQKDFRDETEANLYKELMWLKSAIDGLLPVLAYPDASDKGRELLEARLPGLRACLQNTQRALGEVK